MLMINSYVGQPSKISFYLYIHFQSSTRACLNCPFDSIPRRQARERENTWDAFYIPNGKYQNLFSFFPSKYQMAVYMAKRLKYTSFFCLSAHALLSRQRPLHTRENENVSICYTLYEWL